MHCNCLIHAHHWKTCRLSWVEFVEYMEMKFVEEQGSEIKSWWEMAGERSRGQFFKIDCSASS